MFGNGLMWWATLLLVHSSYIILKLVFSRFFLLFNIARCNNPKEMSEFEVLILFMVRTVRVIFCAGQLQIVIVQCQQKLWKPHLVKSAVLLGAQCVAHKPSTCNFIVLVHCIYGLYSTCYIFFSNNYTPLTPNMNLTKGRPPVLHIGSASIITLIFFPHSSAL